MSHLRGADVTVTVDATRTYQRMAGFGTSERVFEDPHLTNDRVDPATGRVAVTIPQEAQDELLDKLYVELRLTRVRPMLWGRGIQPIPNGAFDFAGVRNDAHVGYVRRAIDRGVDTYFLSPLQLEKWMTEARPEAYVAWAMAIVRRWRDLGVDLPHHAIVNEPGYQRSGVWSGEFIREVIKLMGPQLQAEGFGTRFVVPDDLNATQAAQRCAIVLADAEARRYIGALGFHLYDEPLANAAQMVGLSEQYGLPLWMTEWSQRDAFEWANTMQTC